MTIDTLKELSQSGKYFLVRKNGNTIGVVGSRTIALNIRRGRVTDDLTDYSHKEISFMEYVSMNTGFYTRRK